jgi:predicted Co/Zn/Cd cation transporter (cation efflux family)
MNASHWWTTTALWLLLLLGLCFWLLAAFILPVILHVVMLGGGKTVWLELCITVAFGTWGCAAFWVAIRRLIRRHGGAQ